MAEDRPAEGASSGNLALPVVLGVGAPSSYPGPVSTKEVAVEEHSVRISQQNLPLQAVLRLRCLPLSLKGNGNRQPQI